MTLDPTIEAETRVAPEISRMSGSSAGTVRDPSAAVLNRLESHAQKKTRYVFKGEIARGGMGVVLKVWDEDLRRNLAMKVVLGDGDQSGQDAGTPVSAVRPKMLGRFLEEAQVTAQLDHPGIVPVHELGLDDRGRVYFTMQLVKGQTLREVFRAVHEGEDGWTQTRALMVILKVCEAMSFAHSKGVIHRDLKPDNVMVGRFGEMYVMDWGLARVLGHEDLRDIRIESPSVAPRTVIDSDRREAAGSSHGESTLYTMDGDVVGTPAYMAPEQARGEIDKLSPRSDVYALGAILYHLLTGQAPYTPVGVKKLSQHMVWRWVLEGPPKPIHELTREVPAELAAICDKAMAREPEDRYQDMADLGEDLRAYVENRVVRAYETGAVAELRKWVVRNKGLAASTLAGLVLAMGGLAAVVFIKAAGEKRERQLRNVAVENATEAQRQESIARLEREKVLRLSAFQDLEDLEGRAQALWPARPETVPEYEAWLGDAAKLVAGLHAAPGSEIGGHYQTLEELRARAVPATPEEIEQDRRANPRYQEYVTLRNRRDTLRRARAVREARAVPASFQIDPGDLPASAEALNEIAWPLVDPQRTEFGREAEGLAVARQTLETAAADERAAAADTLAWAYFANGLDDDAIASSEAALDAAAPAERAEYEGYLGELEAAIQAARGEPGRRELERVEAELAEVEADVSGRLTWRFENTDDQWWHDQLEELVADINAFADEDTGLVAGTSKRWGWGIERRLEFARTVKERTISGPRASELWRQAIASIADPRESPEYGGLRIEPQLGLIPVGRDPESNLWEFAHLQSGTIPVRARDGELVVTEETAIVLVLLPGGTFTMGAQAENPAGPNYDPEARPREGPVHEVTLDPFFVSKYEMTQGQWQRFTVDNPSQFYPGCGRSRVDLTSPVEQVSLLDCNDVLSRMELGVPTEAQWEYAARGGSDLPWWTGPEEVDLEGAANLADRYAISKGAGWSMYEDWLDDGHWVHAPVGSFDANRYGLHDVYGNVWEWCRDLFESYVFRARKGDGLRQVRNSTVYAVRGGAFNTTAFNCRSAERNSVTPQQRASSIGVRPVRAVERTGD